MPKKKKLKNRIRQRMERTETSYTTARDAELGDLARARARAALIARAAHGMTRVTPEMLEARLPLIDELLVPPKALLPDACIDRLMSEVQIDEEDIKMLRVFMELRGRPNFQSL